MLQTHRHLAHCRDNILLNEINMRFDIQNITALIKKVCQECFICALNQRQPCGKGRQNLSKQPQLIRRKLVHFQVDELQIGSEKTGLRVANFNKILIGIDIFSHYVVMCPLYEKVFLDFLQQHIIAKFGMIESVTTDNASTLNSSLVKNVCAVQGIWKLTSSAYSARSNLCELANRSMLDTLQNMTAEIYCPTTYFHLLLVPTVLLINSLTFGNHKYLSPHLIVFGTLPRQGVISIFEGHEQIFEGKDDYIKSIILLNDAFSKIRLAQIEKARL